MKKKFLTDSQIEEFGFTIYHTLTCEWYAERKINGNHVALYKQITAKELLDLLVKTGMKMGEENLRGRITKQFFKV